jgi:replicative DNA helicase
MAPGTLTGFIGRPGDAKTSLLISMARHHAEQCPDNDVVVFVSWEEVAEEFMAMLMSGRKYTRADVAWGRVDLGIVDAQVSKKGLPIYFIGKSIARAGKAPPVMTVDLVLGTIESMQEAHGVRPAICFFDYIQRIPVKRAADKVHAVTQVPDLLKELAKSIGVPAVAAIQSARTVESRKIKLASYDEAQWSSAIEQTCDKLFALWRPARSEPLGEIIEGEKGTYVVTENLLLMRLLKQRGAPARHTWALHFDPATLELSETQTKKLEEVY